MAFTGKDCYKLCYSEQHPFLLTLRARYRCPFRQHMSRLYSTQFLNLITTAQKCR